MRTISALPVTITRRVARPDVSYRRFGIVLGAMGLFIAPSTSHASCIINGSTISGTCRQVSAYTQSGATQDQELSSDGATSAQADLTLPSTTSFFEGHAASDLSAGTLRVYTDGSGSSNASWLETVKFDLPDGVTSIDIPITVRLEGVNTERPGSLYNNIGLAFQAASYGNSSHFDRVFVQKWCGFEADFTDSICKSGSVSVEYTDTLTIWEDVYYQFNFYVNAGGLNIKEDFASTGIFSWDLPDNVSFVSSSGVFMAAANASGVPEPTTWAMMLVGFGAIGFTMRRKQHQTLRVKIC